jgi:hypothetical protein
VLTLRNLRDNGGSVSFLVNGRRCELGPGEAHEFSDEPAWRIQYHRGDGFENEEHTLAGGHYAFVVTAEGWVLEARP